MTQGFLCSTQQKFIWQNNNDNIPVISLKVEIEYTVNEDLMRQTVYQVCESHEMLSVKIAKSESFKYPQQFIQDNLLIRFAFIEADLKSAVAKAVNEILKEDLAGVVSIIQEENRTWLTLNFSALHADFQSLVLLCNQILNCYEHKTALSKGEEGLQYIDYSEWQNEKQAESDDDQWLDLFGKKKLTGLLPFERFGCKGDVSFEKELINTAQLPSDSIDLVLLLCWQQVLSRFNENVIVGVNSDMRLTEELKYIVGPLTKYYPFRVGRDDNFDEKNRCARRFRDQVKGILENFDPLHHGSPKYLFEFNEADFDQSVEYDFCGNPEDFSLKLSILKTNHSLDLKLWYDSERYDSSTVKNLLKCLQSEIDAVSKSSNLCLSDSEAESIKSLAKGVHILPNHDNIISSFQNQVRASPNIVAVKFDKTELTYAQLEDRSNKLARTMRSKWNIGEGKVVAVLLSRSERQLLILLSILKAGAAYLPVDLYAPIERKNLILEDAYPALVITSDSEESLLYKYQCVEEKLLDQYAGDTSSQTELPNVSNKSLAYIIYTSGTTGKPKGVQISHKALNNYVNWFNNEYGITKKDSTVLMSSIAYDLGYSSLWTVIAGGGTLHVMDESQYLEVKELAQLIENSPVTYLKMTPSHLKMLSSSESFKSAIRKSSLERIFLGGEPIDIVDVEELFNWKADLKVVNHYGPTETTIGTLVNEFDLNTFPSFKTNPTIGKPIGNASAYVLNESNELVPFGHQGELHIAGVGLSEGYLKREDLTKRKFVLKEELKVTLYKTGDLVRLWPDGNISFVGRIDNQIKIRGYRVELEEIENTINNYPDVRNGVIKLGHKEHSKTKFLIAYLQCNDSFNKDDFITFLKSQLPFYMIPEQVITLDKLPLNANGKVDRSQLSYHQRGNLSFGSEKLPTTSTEKRLCSIWEDVLEIESISVNQSFFDVGGHSLLATKLISKIKEELKVDVSLKNIFNMLTIEKLAAFIDESAELENQHIFPVKKKLYYEVSPAQRQIWVLNQVAEHSTVFNMPKAFVLEGEFDKEVFQQSINALVSRHEALRTTFMEVGGEPKQIIQNAQWFENIVEYIDLNQSDELQKAAAEIIHAEANKPFDLVKGPLFRTVLIKANESLRVIAFNMHHIISDAWSKEVILKEFKLLYEAFVDGRPSPLEPLKIQYKDYVSWLIGESLNKDKEYWLDVFRDIPEPLQLSTDFERPKVKTTNGGAVAFALASELSADVVEFAKDKGVSLFIFYMTCLKILLFRYTNQKDIVVGTPVSGREIEQLNDQVGLYLNNLAIRSKFDQNDTFWKVLEICKENILTAFEHQAYPFDELLNDLNLKRDFSRSPLYDVVLVLGSNNYSGQTTPANGSSNSMQLNPVQTGFRKSIVDLRFVFAETKKGGVGFMIEYNIDLFSEETIRQMGDQFIELLRVVISHPDIQLNEMSFGQAKVEGEVSEEQVEEDFNFSF